MNNGQKVIKYIAIAFAVFLSVNIIGAIIGAILFGLTIFNIGDKLQNDNEVIVSEDIVISQEYENIEKIKIEIGYSKLEIKKGDVLKIESNVNNDIIDIKKSSDTLIIKEDRKWNFFNDEINSNIIITIPEYHYFEKIDIEAGSGQLKITELQTNELDLDVGAGNVIISNIIVEKKSDMDGGAGKVIVKDSILNNLDLDVGVGEFQILNTELLDNNDIDAGIGKLEISLKGKIEDYKIIPSRGIGSFTIQGDEIENDKTYGDGENKIKIDAGIGKVDVSYIE